MYCMIVAFVIYHIAFDVCFFNVAIGLMYIQYGFVCIVYFFRQCNGKIHPVWECNL